jgi:DNA replication protein DnaC
MTFGIKRTKFDYDLEVALDFIRAIGKSIEPGYILTPDIKGLYIKLIQYIYADDHFQGDLTKGLLLQGPTGTGKTLAMEIMSNYLKLEKIRILMNGKVNMMVFSVTNVNDIVNTYPEHGFDGIQQYINRNIICLDDIGTEFGEVKYYGNSLDVLDYVISERYNKRKLTFATTNFPPNKLEEIYSDRIFSRMCAMFNFIPVMGNDFRRKINKNNLKGLCQRK